MASARVPIGIVSVTANWVKSHFCNRSIAGGANTACVAEMYTSSAPFAFTVNDASRGERLPEELRDELATLEKRLVQ